MKMDRRAHARSRGDASGVLDRSVLARGRALAPRRSDPVHRQQTPSVRPDAQPEHSGQSGSHSAHAGGQPDGVCHRPRRRRVCAGRHAEICEGVWCEGREVAAGREREEGVVGGHIVICGEAVPSCEQWPSVRFGSCLTSFVLHAISATGRSGGRRTAK